MGTWAPGTPIERSSYFWQEPPAVLAVNRRSAQVGPTFVDLFAGAGGFSCGFEMVGFQSILGVDIHRPSVDTWHLNHPGAGVIIGDLQLVEVDLLTTALGGTPVDAIAAGVPCQGFSRSNRKRHDGDDRNQLFREFVRIIRSIQPRVVVLENVSGMRSAAGGAFVREISAEISDCGYEVSVQQLNAADYGVPQRRQRIFFVGVQSDMRFAWPSPTHETGRHVSVWDAIGDLPSLTSGESASAYAGAPFSPYQQMMRGAQTVLHNHVAPTHPSEVVERIRKTLPGEPMYSAFRQRIRLHRDRPSPTQLSGGIRPQFQFGHPVDNRGLTVRERCRLQSFPDHYEICGGVTQGRVQTGNAVPPLLAAALGRSLLDALSGTTPAGLPTAERWTAAPEQLALNDGR